MIRKIIFFISFLIIIFWLLGAYYIKNKLSEGLNEFRNNNIEFSYKSSSIGGFPFNWRITLSEPRITLINQKSIQELFAKEIKLSFDYGLKNLRVNLPSSLKYNFTKSSMTYNYSLVGSKSIKADVGFIESLYNIDENIWEKNYINLVNLHLPQIKVALDKHDIFHINDYNFKIIRDVTDDIDTNKIIVNGDYKSDVNYLKIDSAHLSLDIDYKIKNHGSVKELDTDFDRKIDINKFVFKFNNALLDMNGELNLSRKRMPSGHMNIDMEQYHDVIDFVIPEDFLVSRSYIKKIIAKIAMAKLNKVASNIDKVNLDIKFSDQGVSIGNLNLLELNGSK